MILRTSDTEALKKAFPMVYPVKEGTAIADAWQLRAMRRIHRIGRVKPCAVFWSALENLVWGLTPGSSILILALAIICVRMYLNLGHDYLSTVAAYLGKVSLAELLGYKG
jgi:hypothetical protein